MSLTFQQAYDEVLERFKTQWDADTPAVTGTVPDVEYDNLEQLDPKPTDDAWARVKVQFADADQATLGDIGGRLFDRDGLVTVQLFVPQGEGVTLALSLGKIAMDAFEGKKTTSTEVWFRNVRLADVGPTDRWYQKNVLAEFTYDEQK